MNKRIIIILSCFTFGSSIAQTVYESPCVVDGKTFQLTIPDGFFEVDNGVTLQSTYTTQEALDPNSGSDELKEMALGVISIIYDSRDNHSLEWYKQDSESELVQVDSSIEVLFQPETVKINEREILFLSFKGEINGQVFNACHSAVFPFGDRAVKVQYVATEKLTEFIEFDEFTEILSSLNEVETTKEDAQEKDLMEEIEKMIKEKLGDYAYPRENDLFETNISKYEIGPIFDADWRNNWDASSHLMEEYVYKVDKGGIQLFSGGKSEDYPTKKEMELAIQKVLETATTPTISYVSKYSSDLYTFKKHKVSGAGTIKEVYTAEIKNEMFFFLIDEGSNPASDFKSAAHDYIMLFHIEEPEPPAVSPPPPGPVIRK